MDRELAIILLLRAGVNLNQNKVSHFLAYVALADKGIPRPQVYRQLIRTHQVSLQTIKNSVRWGEQVLAAFSSKL